MRKKRKVVSNKAGNEDLHHLKLFQIIASRLLPSPSKKSSCNAIALVSIYNSQEKPPIGSFFFFFSRSLFFFFFFFFLGRGGDLLLYVHMREQ